MKFYILIVNYKTLNFNFFSSAFSPLLQCWGLLKALRSLLSLSKIVVLLCSVFQKG